MKNLTLHLPQLVLIVGTRALLGAGVALLLADSMNRQQRQSIGWTLGLIGALTTIPLAMEVIAQNRTGRGDRPLS